MANKAACIVVCSYICGVFGEDIADDLIDGIIALFPKSVINKGKSLLKLSLLILIYRKRHCLFVVHRLTSLSQSDLSAILPTIDIITYFV